jgi:hypothetical protein
MITKMLTGLIGPQQLARGSLLLRNKINDHVTQALTAATRSAGAHGAAMVHQYAGDLTLALPLIDAMRELDALMRGQGGRWTKLSADVVSRGGGICIASAAFRAAPSFRVRVKPITMTARGTENTRRRERGYDWCMERVQYEYEARFELAGGADHSSVSYHTIETIDPFGHAVRDLNLHYRAPLMPRGFGALGDRFLANLRQLSC